MNIRLYRFFIYLLILVWFKANAQIDTLYVIKNGDVVFQSNISDIDTIIFYSQTFTDQRDGNIYNQIMIGEQMWMAENLRFLPIVTGPGLSSETQQLYYVYGYNGTDVSAAMSTINYNTYGVIYNWAAAMDGANSSPYHPSGVKGICPSSWHLPSDNEWEELSQYLGDIEWAGAKMKEKGTIHWMQPNTGATNESGFTALPGGNLTSYGTFGYIYEHCYWWSSTESSSGSAFYRDIGNAHSELYRNTCNKAFGFYVRCIKD